MSEAGPVLYDPVELRRRIAVCFSVGELKELADSLGVGGVPWERGIHEAAREVVRQCERYAGLPALVGKLREVRPLVEWPEPAHLPLPPTTAALAPRPPVPPTLASEAAPLPPAALPATAAPAGVGPPALSASPGSFSPLADPYAPPPGPPAIQVPPVATGAPSAPPLRAGWPGVAGEPAATGGAGPGGVDPRILLAVGGLMVAAAIIAYFAGRASTAAAPSEGPPAGSATAAATGPAHAGGPAALAADALARSFADLARVCELPSSAGTSALVIRRVFERCGPGAPPRRPYSPPSASPSATGEASAPPPPPFDPAAGRGRRQGRGGDTAPAEAKGCPGACASQHDACRSGCGPEPTESSAYDGYQRCLGRCLSAASRCKLSCR